MRLKVNNCRVLPLPTSAPKTRLPTVPGHSTPESVALFSSFRQVVRPDIMSDVPSMAREPSKLEEQSKRESTFRARIADHVGSLLKSAAVPSYRTNDFKAETLRDERRPTGAGGQIRRAHHHVTHAARLINETAR